MTRLRTVCTPVPGIAIWYDFVTPAEEQYLIHKIDAVGGDPQPQPESAQDGSEQSSDAVASNQDDHENGSGPPTTATATTSTGSTPRKAWGWKDLNGRRSMYWGGTVTPSGSLVPAPFPTFMDSAWPHVLDRIAETGVYDGWTGNKGKGKERGPNHCLVNEYLPGQGIMPHTDGPAYLHCTSTLSLGSHTVLCLRSKPSHLASSSSSSSSSSPNTDPNSIDADGDEQARLDRDRDRAASIAAVQKLDLFLPARSLLVLTSTLYSDWLHGIAPLKGDSIDSLKGCANWDDFWEYRRAEGGGGGGGEKEREMVEAGKGWERQRRISLTCRRVAGKVRNLGSMLGLGGGGGASRGARRS